MTTIKEMKMARGLETMMEVTNNDPGHIARAKAKAEQAKEKLVESLKREAMQAVEAENAAKAKANAHKVAERKQRIKSTKIALMAVSFVLGSMIGYIYAMLMI